MVMYIQILIMIEFNKVVILRKWLKQVSFCQIIRPALIQP